MEYVGQHKQKISTDLLITVLLLVAGIVFFPLKGVSPSPDSAWYLNNALKLYTDFSYENLMIRRPLFPFLISLSFQFLGNSIENGFWVVRLFFVFNLLLSYFVGLRLFNRSTGIAFSLLLLSSFVINRWSSYLLVDAIIPFFLFAYLLALYLAFENESRSLFCLSGLILGLAFLVKGVFAFFFMFLPVLLLLLNRYRTLTQIKNAFCLYATAALVLLPWLWYCIANNDFFVLVGPMFQTTEIQASGVIPVAGHDPFSLRQFIADQINDLKGFYGVYIKNIFVLSHLFLAGMIYAVIRLVFSRKRMALVYLFFSLVVFSPVIYIGMKSGGANFRHGQFLILYFLLYLMTAFMIADLSNGIAGLFFDGGKQRRTKQFLLVCFLGACLFFQVFVGAGFNGRRTFFNLMIAEKVKTAYGFSYWQGDFNARDGWANDATRAAAEWIQSHVPKNETILCQWHYLKMLDYLTDNQYDFQFIEYSRAVNRSGKKALFVWPRYPYQIMEGNSLVSLYEEDFLSQINQNRVETIVVTYRRNFLTRYLQDHPDFMEAQSLTRGKRNIKIFKTRRFPVRPHPRFHVNFHVDIYHFFQWAAQHNPPVFAIRKKEIQQILNWDDDQITRFESLVKASDKEQFWQAYDMVRPKTIY